MQGIDPAMLQQLMGGQMGGMGGPPPPLAKFKAGRCDFKEKDGGPTLTVTPSKRKGLIMCTKDESGMTHFQWKDRESNSVVEDIIVMPGEWVFEKIDTGREGDRVYVMQFKSGGSGSGRRMFFWMQTKLDHDDDANAKKVNTALDGGGDAGGAAGAAGAGAGSVQEQQQMLMQMLMGGGGGGGSPAATASSGSAAAGSDSAGASPGTGGAAGSPGGANVQLADLQAILGGMGVPNASPPAGSGSASEATASTPSDNAAEAAPAENAPAATDGENQASLAPQTPAEAGTTATPTNPPPAPAGGAAGGNLQVGDLAAILGNMGAMQGQGAGGSNAGAGGATLTTPPQTQGAISAQSLAAAFASMQQSAAMQAREPPFQLSDLVNHSNLAELIEGNEEMQQALIPTLPEGLQNREELFATLRSPQLRQALGALSSALYSDNYNTVMANFGLDPSAGQAAFMSGDSISAFLDAVQASAADVSGDGVGDADGNDNGDANADA